MLKKLSVFLLVFCAIQFSVSAQQIVTVHGNQPADTAIRFMQGFLHGGPAYLDSAMVAQLKPEFWRLGAYMLAGSGFEDAEKFNPEIIIVLNDLYMIQYNIPSQTQSQPWVNSWTDWDALVAGVVTNAVVNNAQVDYWDVWGEPDNFWTGTPAQFIEMHRRTDSIIQSIAPGAKISGPEFAFGTCNFSVVPILDFLDQLYLAGLHVDAVSWHEFCSPEDIPVHVQELRDSLAVRPWLGNLKIQITEYSGPFNQVIPGWHVGWLHYLEKAKVDWASHACWDETDGTVNWSDCEKGLNGLFMSDNTTPQPNYWVHRAYAECGTQRLETSTNAARCVAIAGTDSVNQEMKIIVGRYDNPNLGQHNASSNVDVKILNYSYCTSCTMPVVIQRIPSNNVAYSVPLNAPQMFMTGTVTFTGDSATISIPNFVDGDVYILYINPSPGVILGVNEVSQAQVSTAIIDVFPNPFSDRAVVNTAAPLNNATLIWYNSLGQAVKTQEQLNGQVVELERGNLPAGIYFLKLSEAEKTIAAG